MDVHNSYIMYYGFTIMYIIHYGFNNALWIVHNALWIVHNAIWIAHNTYIIRP